MSEENLRTVRRSFEAWNRGELEAAADSFHPEVVVHAPEGWPEGAVTEGFEAWRMQAARLRDDWEEAWVDIEELAAVGNDRVFAHLRYLTRGSQAGMDFDTDLYVAFRMQDGRIREARYCWDEAAARRALEAL